VEDKRHVGRDQRIAIEFVVAAKSALHTAMVNVLIQTWPDRLRGMQEELEVLLTELKSHPTKPKILKDAGMYGPFQCFTSRIQENLVGALRDMADTPWIGYLQSMSNGIKCLDRAARNQQPEEKEPEKLP
jgi:hypothetical protein